MFTKLRKGKKAGSRGMGRKSVGAFGVVALGCLLLAGCGGSSGDAVWGMEPVRIGASGGESQEQGGQESREQGQEQGGQESQGQGGQEQSGQESQGQGSQEQGGAESRERGQEQGYGQGGERIRLTLGTFFPEDMEKVVEPYNEQNGKYYVEIVNYRPEHYDNAVFEAAIDRFRMDIGTGKGTDIICLDGLVADDLGYGGALLDLNTFLALEAKQGRYLGNILECAQTGEALYEIAPAFSVQFIAGDGCKLGMENGWTLEEMEESFRQCGKDGSALAGGGVRTAVTLVEYSIEDFVDWGAGKADFCKTEFYRILEFGREADGGRFIRPTRESVASGTHLAGCCALGGVGGIQYLRWLFGENMAVKGYPCSDGTGVAVNFQGPMGINSYSRYPEGAWDFLEFYVDAGWTDRKIYLEGGWIDEEKNIYQEGAWIEKDFSSEFPGGFPVNRALFDRLLEGSMVQRYYPEGDDAESGKPYPLLQGEGEVPDFYANSAEDVRMLREIVALADRRSFSFSARSAVSLMIEEEISGYNAGMLTAEQTAEKIQNRVQLYLDEHK